MSDDLIPFDFNGASVRVINEGGNALFIAADVAEHLDHRDATSLVRGLDDDERGAREVCTPSGTQKMTVITEAGLYRLVMRSNKPEAKPFQKWAAKVIEQVRKTGSYSVAPANDGNLIAALGDPNILRVLLSNYAERLEAANAQIAADAPKVALADRCVSSSDMLGVRETAKLLRVNERELVHYLIDKGYAQRLTKRLAVTHVGQIVRGYVDELLDEWTDESGATHTKPRLMVTAKGYQHLVKALATEVA